MLLSIKLLLIKTLSKIIFSIKTLTVKELSIKYYNLHLKIEANTNTYRNYNYTLYVKYKP